MRQALSLIGLVLLGCHAASVTASSDLGVAAATDGGSVDGATSPGDLARSGAVDLAQPSGMPAAGVQKWCATAAYQGDPKTNSSPAALVADGAGHVFLVGFTSPATTSIYTWFVRLDGSNVTTNVIVSKYGEVPGTVVLSPAGAPTMGPALRRTDASGAADPTFTPDANWANAGWPRYQSSGKLVVTAAGKIARLDVGGALDASFATQGSLTPPETTIESMLVDAHDRIYALGYTYASMWQVTRYTVDGAVDAGFATGGTLTLAAPPGNNGYFLATMTGDDLYLDGRYFAAAGDAGDWIVHLGPSGVDMTYGAGGYAKIIGLPNWANAIAAQPDGSLLAVGAGEEWFVGRITPTGAIDRNYGNNGWSAGGTAVIGGPSPAPEMTVSPVAVAVAPDGSGLVALHKQYVQNLYSEESAIVCAYTP